ncbi:PPR: pentatricopeptide repeat domain containing protein [Nitzschia inconspicua]|uniref:PPR: pentatricopeptide repeat domain containing protein n=1 Tax=Nitzschia inconspicua TaxID=303405 RepID=A0A9K3L6J6_9STRA|nr:PPR: pentatricopeptide repeat domain containing protein [Nitzschia inconspicua]
MSSRDNGDLPYDRRMRDEMIYTPDHGERFLPGSDDRHVPSNMAPEPLDHFKRGYQDRAVERERERSNDRRSFGNGGASHGGRGNSYPPRRNSYEGGGGGRGGGRGGGGGRGASFRRSSGGGDGSFHGGGGGGRGERRSSSFLGGDREDRGAAGRGPTVIMGLDIDALVDRLVRPGCDVFRELDETRESNKAVFQSGKAVTAIISNLARRRNLRIANAVWDWIDSIGIDKNTFHYNSMISVCEKVRDYNKALRLLAEMSDKKVAKNEVTFSSAISACEKCGQWRNALDLLEQMKREGAGQTAIAYNAAISACEKGLVPHKALEIFEQMKREGVRPTVVTYSALISAAEKGQQWKLALEVLEEMKAAGHGANVIAYSAAISALSKGQQWHKALELFREIEASGGKPSIVTYNATMTALEKGLQWERALDLFDEMKMKNMPVTVVSYGSAISACEKGMQYRQCLEYLDEMTEMGIKKNVIIFGAAMSCMEKSCRADIAFQLMERMKLEDVAPNVHIYNSAISACARCNLWEKGYELFKEMDEARVARDVVTFNAVLDAVSSQIELGRTLFKEGVERGFYARVSRLGSQWLELDLHFLSLGGGEIALGWWFEECLVPYLVNTSKLEAVQSISIVTGYGKTRSRGARMNDDGMRLRVRAMLKYMNIKEAPQPNKGRIHIDKAALIDEVRRNGGKIRFDIEGYTRFKEEETTSNKFPDVPQQVRPRFRPARPGEGPPGTFIRDGDPVTPYNPSDAIRETERDALPMQHFEEVVSHDPPTARRSSSYVSPRDGRDLSQGRPGFYGTEQDRDLRRGPRDMERWREYEDDRKAAPYRERSGERSGGDLNFRRAGNRDYHDERLGYEDTDRRDNPVDYAERRGSHRDYDPRGSARSIRGYDDSRSPYQSNDRHSANFERPGNSSRPRISHADREERFSQRGGDRDYRGPGIHPSASPGHYGHSSGGAGRRQDLSADFRAVREDPEVQAAFREEEDTSRKRSYDEYQKQQPPSRGYDIEPSYARRRSS